MDKETFYLSDQICKLLERLIKAEDEIKALKAKFVNLEQDGLRGRLSILEGRVLGPSDM